MKKIASSLIVLCLLLTQFLLPVTAKETIKEVSVGSFRYGDDIVTLSAGIQERILKNYNIDIGKFAEDFDIGDRIVRDGQLYLAGYSVFPAGNYSIKLDFDEDIPGLNNPLICKFTITKIDPVITDLPEPIADVSYGKCEPLILGGKVKGGTMTYSLTGNEVDFSEKIPTTEDVHGPGTYSVYYKVIGDENHNDLPVDFIITDVTTGVLVDSFTAENDDEYTRGWGTKRIKTASDGKTYNYWVDNDGTSSTIITDDDIIWLYVEYVDQSDINGNPIYRSCWFGISNFRSMNGQRMFKTGSRFHVNILSPYSAEWQPLWNNIDGETRKKLNPDKLSIIEIGITNPDGNEYSDLGDMAELFMQHSFDFSDKSGIIASDIDENIAHVEKTLPMSGLTAPESGRYSVFLLNHFDFAFYLNNSENSPTGSTVSDSNSPVLTICIISGIALIAVGTVVALVVVKKKKKKAEYT